MRQQDSQCTYNITLRCVRATIVVVEKATSITQPVCVFVELGIQHAIYCHLWPAPLHRIFLHYVINGTIF